MRQLVWIPLLAITSSCRLAIDESKVLDLTHEFSEETVYWPTAESFKLERVAYGIGENGKWYAANNYSAAEHGGTHLDAPIHFAAEQDTTEKIPIGRFIGPARVIDIRMPCEHESNYLLTPEDIHKHESAHGLIEPGSVVLVLTGFGKFYPHAREYLGSDRRGVAEGLSFPGIGAEAARVLVERRIDLVGLDTASIDHGPTADFPAHRVFAAAGIPGVENIAHLEKLPPAGATIIALPMKIKDGTGGPCRVIAILP